MQRIVGRTLNEWMVVDGELVYELREIDADRVVVLDAENDIRADTLEADRGQIDAYGAPPSCRGIVASKDALPPMQQCVFAVRPPWPNGEFLTPFIDSGEDLNMTIDVELNLLASDND